MISVIVPVYNVGKYLAQCLDSILNQTYRDLEIILIDDGSTDNSGQICDAYRQKDYRVKVVHTENGGVSRARNLGLACATGEFVAFVDGDDYILETMYEKLHEAIKDKEIAFCRFMHVYPDKKVFYEEKNLEYLVDTPFDFKYIMVDRYSLATADRVVCDKVYGSIWRQLFVRKIIEDHNIRFKENVKIAEDRLFLLEYLIYCNSMNLVDEHLYCYRMGVSQSATSVFHKYRKGLPEAQKNLVNYQLELLEKNEKLSDENKKTLAEFLKYKACEAVVLNEIKHNRENATENLNRAFQDKFFRNALTLRCFITMRKEYKVSIKKMGFYFLIAVQQWNLISKILR